MGMDSGDPGNPCSDPMYASSHAECGSWEEGCAAGMYGGCFDWCSPFGDCSLNGSWNWGYGGDGSFGGGLPAGSGTATSSSSAPQPPLAGGMGASCGPFGCVNPPFQNMFQEPIPPGQVWQFILRLLEEYGPRVLPYVEQCARNLHACVTLFKVIGGGTVAGVKTVLNESLGCADAPCIQSALQNIQQQQLNGTWQEGPKKPMVVAKQPTVITVTAQPDPRSIVPVH
jgi:hypothetical protein